MITINVPKSSNELVCEYCDYVTCRPSQFARHLMTSKHKMVIDDNQKSSKAIQCECGKQYKHLSGLSRHKKNCTIGIEHISSNTQQSIRPSTSIIDATLVIELLKQNQEFKDLMVEQSKQILEQQQQNNLLMEQQNHNNHKLLEAVKDGKIGNTIHNNNNTTNNKFNLNFFLNETCKDAITMSDFINSIEVTLEDFIQTGNIGSTHYQFGNNNFHYHQEPSDIHIHP